MTIELWTVVEFALSSDRDYANPLWDAVVQFRFTAPSGQVQVIDAFWDGGRTFRVRFAPTETGVWRWQSECSDMDNAGLHGQSGSFECVAYSGDNPLYRHGSLRVAFDRLHLEHADGTPFFWLSDTAWNGVLRAQAGDWTRYLQSRREQQFTAIQFVATQWRGSTTDPTGETAYTGADPIQINLEFFQRLDPKVAAINAHGMIAAPVMLWANQADDPGLALSEADAIRLARYQLARWGAYQVVWILGGDSNYDDNHIERWRHIGRAVFGDQHDRLVTMHPQGVNWTSARFRDEDWCDFIGYQSGHGDGDDWLRWHVDGPPAHDWQTEPVMPVINLEPNYEGHPSYHSDVTFTAYEVRRAAYWSLLRSPTAGVTLGLNPIWVWREDRGPAENHANLTDVQPWHAALETEAVTSMTALLHFFADLRWWALRPAPELLAEQPGTADLKQFVAAARTTDGAQAVIYMPVGNELYLNMDALPGDYAARWVNPRNGNRHMIEDVTAYMRPPTHQDWLLVLERDRMD